MSQASCVEKQDHDPVVAQIAEYALQGRSLTWVAQHTGIPRSTLQDKAEQAGIVFSGSRVSPTQVRRAAVEKALRAGHSVTEAATLGGVHRQTATRIAKALGLGGKAPERLSAEKKQKVIDLHARGMRVREICKAERVSNAGVRRILRAQGVQFKAQTRWTKAMDETVIKLYAQIGPGYGPEAARLLGRTSADVRSRARRLGLTRK